jgi:hypothetical protein
MVATLLYFFGVLAAAACFALIEIQIEGKDGWARNLPTWRVSHPLLNWLFPDRPLTGYHFWILVFIAIVAHLPFALGLPWSIYAELRAIAFVLFFWVFEDFLWFVLNPHFGIRRFRPQYIAWHRRNWWWLAPRDYWIALVLAIVLYVVSQTEPTEVILVMKTP